MLKVVVWGESLFQFYSLKPIIESLKQRHAELEFVVPNSIKADVIEYLQIDNNQVITINQVIENQGKLRSTLIKLAQKFFIQAYIPDDFSVMYERLRVNGEIVLLKKLFKKLSRPEINKGYGKFMNIFRRNPFPEKKILTITNIGWHYMLGGLKPMCCIMESWDHPIKRPFMVDPDITFTWNNDLKEEIQEYQGLKDVRLITPLKFRYIEEYGDLTEDDLQKDLSGAYLDDLNKMKENSVVYIASVSSRNKEAFKGEVALIQQIISYCKNKGLQLYLKPKPNGVPDEFDFLKCDSVHIGVYGDGTQSKVMLDENYHKYRLALLKKAGLIINVYTTFALEAALANKPILQLDLVKNDFFGHFAELRENPHIKKYLLHDLPIHKYDGNQEKLNLILDESITSDRKMDYSNAIKEWIKPDVGLKESTEIIVNAIASL